MSITIHSADPQREARERAEHEALSRFQVARRAKEAAIKANTMSERLMGDACEGYDESRLEMRRISER